ncbi:MAG: helix-turn-helix transcriptional regulator [Bacilli bacterium]|nr:helix-turn-helix transcriptional regulator [Bacilli bacterium]
MKLNLKDYANKDIIKFLREYGSMTQKDLAHHLKKSTRTVQRYEAGEIGIDLETIRSICQLYDLNLIIESKQKKD